SVRASRCSPFRYTLREIGFISWIGLRGAVPIFLATIPVLAKLPNSEIYVSAAFVCVLASLTLQGWTIAPVARFFGLELPPKPEAVSRTDLDLGSTADRDVASYRVEPDAPALGYRFNEIPLPRRSRIITVIRDGTVMDRTRLEHLESGDYILVLAPAEQFFSLDRLFTSRENGRRRRKRDRGEEVFGEFALAGDTLLGEVALLYGIPVEEKDRAEPVGAYMRRRLRHRVVVGDRVRWGPVELVAREIRNDRVTSVGIELEPEEHPIWRGFRRAFGFD
ncbi:MAG: transporter associated domain-containing protein, partial [Ferrovibrio sp.]